MDRANVDTDQIIPKQFLKRIERTGFGQFLFFDWRFRDDGSDNPDFELNRPQYAGASILLARRNFGCGSSREHAPWALEDYGFRVLSPPVSPTSSTTTVSRTACCRSGSTRRRSTICFARAAAHPGYRLTVDLQTLHASRDDYGLSLSFEVDDFRRQCLLEGLDDIGLTLAHEDQIGRYEYAHGIV